MDPVLQQHTAVIREGDPSQPRSNNPEVNAEAAEPATTNRATVKASDDPEKNKKKKARAKPFNGGKTKKGGKKKGKAIPSDESDESSDLSASDAEESSAEDSGGGNSSEPEKITVRKRSSTAKKGSKKAVDAQKKKSQKAKAKHSKKDKSGNSKAKPSRTRLIKVSDSDSSESDWDSSGSAGSSDETERSLATTKKTKDSSVNQDISTQVARELQRILQLAQTQAPAHLGLGLGAGGGLDPTSGLSALSYPQGRAALGSYGGLRDLSGRSSRPLARDTGLGDLDDDRDGNDPLHDGRRRRASGLHKEKQRSGGSVEREKAKETDFKRVDQVWDGAIHNYKLQPTVKSSSEAKHDGCCFHVRRTFDWEGKYKATWVDIRSKALRECLQKVIGNIKGVSLVDETPKLDPNILFLYLEDLRAYVRTLKKDATNLTGSKKERKQQAVHIEEKRKHLKILVRYLDKDYAKIKASLTPMLEHGLITFELLWALWKPDTLIYTTTYGSHDEPRVFKVDTAEKHFHMTKGAYYLVDGRYLEFDGKQHGYGNCVEEIPEFRGAKKISSLSCYPLKYRKDEAQIRQDLIVRGKKFVTLSGVHYKGHHGMAYYKKKKSLIKVNVNGRIMIDTSIHRRINPNYPVSLVRPKEDDGTLPLMDDEDSDEEGDESTRDQQLEEVGEKPKYVIKRFTDEKGRIRFATMTTDEAVEFDRTRDKLAEFQNRTEDTVQASDGEDSKPKDAKATPVFTDEEYLIASPVVLGFSFGEKLWLEFTVSGVKDISWNDTAYDSLVLAKETKETVKGLVESHKYHAAESIDDVIQGKGKGLVVVLHGPPGTGKTLTAEGISELLKCPLYMVSAGELGTDSRILETELQRILDICHAWGAILLLDEADVFLEKRNMSDIHRNALVSIFLRQLEYFQGILFLTTNRVETFDDAFQSRIHIALRYDSLDQRAKKTIFKMFVERARAQQKTDKDSMAFSDADYDSLARHELNGRQIKNTVIRAQALAVNKREVLSMAHVKQILNVQIDFQRNLKGGTGYQDAMRSYF